MQAFTVCVVPNQKITLPMTEPVVLARSDIIARPVHLILKVARLVLTCQTRVNPHAFRVWRATTVPKIRPTTPHTHALRVITVRMELDLRSSIRAQVVLSAIKPWDRIQKIVSSAWKENIVRVLAWRRRPVNALRDSSVCVVRRAVLHLSMIISRRVIVCVRQTWQVCACDVFPFSFFLLRAVSSFKIVITKAFSLGLNQRFIIKYR